MWKQWGTGHNSGERSLEILKAVPPILFSFEIVLSFAFSLPLHRNCRIQFTCLALCRFFSFFAPFLGGWDRVSTITQAGIGAHHVRQAGLRTGGNSPALDSKVLGIEVPVLSLFISCSAVSRVGPRASCVLNKCSPLNYIPSPLLLFILRQDLTRQSGLTLETREGLNFQSSCLSLLCSQLFFFFFCFLVTLLMWSHDYYLDWFLNSKPSTHTWL